MKKLSVAADKKRPECDSPSIVETHRLFCMKSVADVLHMRLFQVIKAAPASFFIENREQGKR